MWLWAYRAFLPGVELVFGFGFGGVLRFPIAGSDVWLGFLKF
jgi:hypothetical protein